MAIPKKNATQGSVSSTAIASWTRADWTLVIQGVAARMAPLDDHSRAAFYGPVSGRRILLALALDKLPLPAERSEYGKIMAASSRKFLPLTDPMEGSPYGVGVGVNFAVTRDPRNAAETAIPCKVRKPKGVGRASVAGGSF